MGDKSATPPAELSPANRNEQLRDPAGGPQIIPREQKRTMARDSDRWATPATIMGVVRWASLLVLATLGAVTWLVSIGRDPAPVLEAIGAVVTAAAALGGLVLQFANRATTTKIERNTSSLAPGGVPAVVALEVPTDSIGRRGARPPVPPSRASTVR